MEWTIIVTRKTAAKLQLDHDQVATLIDDSQRPQPLCGETLSDAVIAERRNGPRWLRANDDDFSLAVIAGQSKCNVRIVHICTSNFT